MSVLEVVIGLGPEHRDVITTGGAVVIAVVGVIGSIQVALIQSGRKASKRAEDAAQTAVAQTVSNGDDHSAVQELLEQVQAELIAQRRDAERHARQSEERHRESRRDIGGIREEIRLEREERHQLAEYVIDNLPKKDTP